MSTIAKFEASAYYEAFSYQLLQNLCFLSRADDRLLIMEAFLQRVWDAIETFIYQIEEDNFTSKLKIDHN